MTPRRLLPAAFSAAVFLLVAPAIANSAADAQANSQPDYSSVTEFPPDPFPSTYHPLPSVPTLIRHVTVYTGTGAELDDADVLMKDGKVAAVGKGLDAGSGVTVIDGTGKFVTPGIIDIHSHLGVYPSPQVDALSDGNELTNPNTANVRAENSVWPQDPGFNTARAGGVTALEILPGSGNLFGGRSVVLKNVPAVTTEGMKFPDAPFGLKMACGENPKRVYGSKGAFPSTLMGDVAGYRQAWADAQAYDYQWKVWEKDKKGPPPARDLKMETLAEVLNGRVRVQMHCYRANEMADMLNVAKEFHYHIAAFHHAVEAYKIPKLLAANGTCAVMWADWWGFKMEAWDGIRENIPMVDAGGACAMIHSDDENGIQRLNQETAKAWAAGNRVGLNISEAHAVMWMTLNPAKALGIDNVTGSLENGKDADVVLWSGNPFSVYSHAEKVFVDGALVFDRDDPKLQPKSDFELGKLGVTGGAL